MIKEFFKSIFKTIYNFFSLIFFLIFLGVLLLAGFISIVIIFKGQIYIEIIIIYILIYMFLFWKIWFYRSRKKLLKKYKPENDLGRLAEENKKKLLIDNGKTRQGGTFIEGAERIERTESADGNAAADIIRPEQSQGRELLQKADADSVRKNRKGIRKFLRRRK